MTTGGEENVSGQSDAASNVGSDGAASGELSGKEQGSSSALVADAEVSGQAGAASAVSSDLKWYVVHVYSGFEFKAKQALEERVRQGGLERFFGEVKVPQES